MLSHKYNIYLHKKKIIKKIVWLCYKNLSKKEKEKKLCYKIYSKILT